jgi:hypothetical protein
MEDLQLGRLEEFSLSRLWAAAVVLLNALHIFNIL